MEAINKILKNRGFNLEISCYDEVVEFLLEKGLVVVVDLDQNGWKVSIKSCGFRPFIFSNIVEDDFDYFNSYRQALCVGISEALKILKSK